MEWKDGMGKMVECIDVLDGRDTLQYPPSYNWIWDGFTDWIYPYRYRIVIIPLMALILGLDQASRILVHEN